MCISRQLQSSHTSVLSDIMLLPDFIVLVTLNLWDARIWNQLSVFSEDERMYASVLADITASGKFM